MALARILADWAHTFTTTTDLAPARRSLQDTLAATLGGTTARMDPVPALGEHTCSVLREIGYDHATIARLRADGTV